MPFTMGFSMEANTARPNLSGELDGASAPSVRNTVEFLLQSHPERLLLLVKDLSFMASAGLRILIFAKQKQPDVKIYLIQPQEAIIETLKKTGFYQSVYVLKSEEELSA